MDYEHLKTHFEQLGGHWTPKGSPVLASHPQATEQGTPYFRDAGVAVVGRPLTDLTAAREFLRGFGPDLDFSDYLDDRFPLPPATSLAKYAGQTCYLSLGQGRTINAAAEEYFKNIKASGHGSILEHQMFSFSLWGISRSLTHELVRHRTGVAFSQVSQRYVGGKTLRFVERPEFQRSEKLHRAFLARIDLAAATYEETADELLATRAAIPGESKTEARKAVRQAARASLPNETEAPMVFSANTRALRHILEMRCSRHAEPEVRALAFRIFLCAGLLEPLLFEDYEVHQLPDGSHELTTPFRKV